jgi:hypothetical protein
MGVSSTNLIAEHGGGRARMGAYRVELERLEPSPEADPDPVRRTMPAPKTASRLTADWPFAFGSFAHRLIIQLWMAEINYNPILNRPAF